MHELRGRTALNAESPGQLLLSYFWHYGFNFNAVSTIVSIGAGQARDSAFVKNLVAGWKFSPILAIEDPFEKDYNVAHVLRGKTYRLMKLHFVVSLHVHCKYQNLMLCF